MSIGARIRQARTARDNLSQEALGERYGVSRSAVYQWETGATSPSVTDLIDMATFLRVDLLWLLTGQGEPGGGTFTKEAVRAAVDGVTAQAERAGILGQLAKRRVLGSAVARCLERLGSGANSLPPERVMDIAYGFLLGEDDTGSTGNRDRAAE